MFYFELAVVMHMQFFEVMDLVYNIAIFVGYHPKALKHGIV
jgi:hypothetical protein